MSYARRAIAIPARLASRSAVILGLRLLGAVIVFGTQAVIARVWGAELLGHYLLAIAAINLIAAVMPLGFHVIGTYFAAEYRAQGDAVTLRAFARRAYSHIAWTSVAAIVIVVVVAPFAATTTFDLVDKLGLPAIVMAAATALVFVNGAFLVGLKHPIVGFIADTLFRPLAMAAGLAVALGLAGAGSGLKVMIWTAGLAYCGVALVQAGFVRRAMRQVGTQTVAAVLPVSRWWRFALPWIVISLASDFFFDIDLLMLASLMSIEDLAIFGVCTRVFSLIAFGVATVYAVTMPEFLDAQARRDDIGFQRRVADANLIATAFAVAASFAMLFAGPALKLFGPTFAAGTTPLAILCVGLTIRSIMGPAALVLSIHDRPYASFPAIALGLVVLVVGNYLLVPPYGLTGAAAAASLSIALWSVAQWAIALRHTGIDVSVRPRLRELFGAPNPVLPATDKPSAQ